MRSHRGSSARFAVLALLLFPLPGDAETPRAQFFADTNLRLELLEDRGLPKAAQALTFSARGGAEFHLAPRLRLLAELEGAATLAGAFDDGRRQGHDRPRIPDPPNAELNRLMLSGDAWPGWSFVLGRQYFTDSRQRYFGRSGWRQSRQSFDALAIRGEIGPDFRLELAYLDRVWRSSGRFHPDPAERSQRLDAWLANGTLDLPGGRLEAFLHAVAGEEPRVLRHRNQGLRWHGEYSLSSSGQVDLLLEVARQRQEDMRGWLPYRAAELRLTRGGLRLLIGFEHEGGDGQRAFQTPFGSGHSFNGWADRLSSTPADGLLDRYLGLSGRALGEAQWILRRHEFRTIRNGRSLGREWNAELVVPIGEAWLRLKLADHRAEPPSEDLAKFWISLEWALPGP